MKKKIELKSVFIFIIITIIILFNSSVLKLRTVDQPF